MSGNVKFRSALRVEELESRDVLSGFVPTAVEQLFLERLNDARSNPALYGSSIGLNLSGVAPSQALAWDTRLIQAARLHSADMSARNYFSHSTPEALGPGQRLTNAGYPWTAWGESIAAGYPTPETALSALIIDAGVPNLGHRRHLLAIDASFQSHQQIGIGVVQNGGGTYQHYYTLDTGRTADARPFLTGVIFNDVNGNARYDLNEGRAGVLVQVFSGSTLVAQVGAFDTGGYQLQLNPGSYTVRVSGPGIATVNWNVTLGSQNVRLNLAPAAAATSADATWVAGLGHHLLRRDLSPTEVSVWAGYLAGGGTRATVAQVFAASGEYQRIIQADFVARLGVDVLDRQLTATEVNNWVNYLLGGGTRDTVAQIFVSAGYGGLANDAWVSRLAQDLLGRSLTGGELSAWSGYLQSGGARSTVVSIYLNSGEAQARDWTAWLQMLGQDTLGRSLASNEVNVWLNHLRAGGSRESVVSVYTTSAEFNARVGV